MTEPGTQQHTTLTDASIDFPPKPPLPSETQPVRQGILGLSAPQTVVAGVILVLVLGLAVSTIWLGVTLKNYDTAIRANLSTIDALDSDLAAAQSDLQTSQASLQDAQNALKPQNELSERETKLASAESALSEREADVKAREDAITAKEAYIQQTSLTDGKYSTGVSMEPGVYRTESTNTRCYWAVYTSGTNYDDIVQNDLGSTGVLTVTVQNGQDFETQRCGTWQKIG